MSAYIVDAAHIDLLVLALGQSEIAPLDSNEVGQILWIENVLSVAHRYPNEDVSTLPGPLDFDADAPYAYRWRRPAAAFHLDGLLKAVENYEYQSSEHDGYGDSQVGQWIAALKLSLVKQGARSDSHHYQQAPWGIAERHVHLVA